MFKFNLSSLCFLLVATVSAEECYSSERIDGLNLFDFLLWFLIVFQFLEPPSERRKSAYCLNNTFVFFLTLRCM